MFLARPALLVALALAGPACVPSDDGTPPAAKVRAALGAILQDDSQAAAAPPADTGSATNDSDTERDRAFFTYTDASGSIRMVESLEEVPERHRAKARRMKGTVARVPSQGGSGAGRTAASQRASAGAPPRPASAANVVIFTAKWCGWCQQALAHLDQRGVSYRNRDIDDDPDASSELRRLSGSTSIPLLDIDGELVRGFDRARIDALLDRQSGDRPPVSASR